MAAAAGGLASGLWSELQQRMGLLEDKLNNQVGWGVNVCVCVCVF